MARKKGGKGGGRGLPPINYELINQGKKQTIKEIVENGSQTIKQGQTHAEKVISDREKLKSEDKLEPKINKELNERRQEIKESLLNKEKKDVIKDIIKEKQKDEPDKDEW